MTGSTSEELKRKRIARLASDGAKIKRQGKMCDTCAFKLNSDANMEPHNVDAAFEALAYYGQFNCHKEIGVNKGCECIGFKHAKQLIEDRN